MYTVWRKALWKMLHAIGVNKKLVNIIKVMYKKTQCSVMMNGQITEWFEVAIEVKTGLLAVTYSI